MAKAQSEQGTLVVRRLFWNIIILYFFGCAGCTIDVSLSEKLPSEKPPANGSPTPPNSPESKAIMVSQHLTNFPAGGSSSLSVKVVDSDGNIMVDDDTTEIAFQPTPNLKITNVIEGVGDGSYGVLGASEIITATNGEIEIIVSGTLAHQATITISNNSTLTNPAAEVVLISPDSSSQIVMVQAAADFNAGATANLTVEVRDGHGNLLESDSNTQITFDPTLSGTITGIVTGTGDGSYSVIGGAETVTVSGGVATVTLTDLVAETFLVAITNGSLLSNPADDSILVSPAAANKIVISSAGSDFAAGNSTALTVQIQDSYNNLVTSNSSTQITFDPTLSGTITGIVTGTGDGSYSVIGGAETITVSGGVATVTLTDLVAETFLVAITNGSLLSNPADDSITVSVGAATKISFTTPGSDFPVDSQTSVGISVQDVGGNLVSTDNTTVVTFDPSLGGTITGVTVGSGDGSYGLLGGIERVQVVGGLATITVTNLALETFEVAITNNGSLINPSNDSITTTSSAALLAYWKFDEGSGTSATDSSGNGNHGTITGASWTSGKSGGALSFNGANRDYVEITGLLGSPANVTISAWIFPTSTDVKGAEVLNVGDYLAIRTNWTEQTPWVSAIMGSFYSAAPGFRATFLPVSLDASSGWHHLAYTVDDTNNVQRLYFDGVLVGTRRTTQSIQYSGWGTNTFIGRHGNGDIDYDYTGIIDEIRVYNRALSALEIKNIHHQFSDVIGHWTMDEGSGTSLADSSGQGRDGIISGATWASGIGSYGLSFDGIDDIVTIAGLMGSPANITVSGWTKLTSVDTWGARFLHIGDAIALNLDYPSGCTGLRGVFQKPDTTFAALCSNTFYQNTGWHHLAYTFDDSLNLQALFVDGQSVATAANTNSILYSGTTTTFGRDAGGGTVTDFGGVMDDIQFVARRLTNFEVGQLFNRAPGLVGFFPLNEGAGATTADASGFAINSLTLSGGAGWSTGPTGYSNAVSFDGVDDYISIPVYNFDEISITGWFYKNSNDAVNADAIIGGWSWNADPQLNQGFDVRFFQGQPNQFNFKLTTQNSLGTRSTGDTYYDFGDSTLAWHHFAVTYNKTTGEQKLYVNGVLRDTDLQTAGNVLVPLTAYSDMRIGHSRVNTGFFNGKIDDIRIFSRPLTDQEVVDIYNNQSFH